MTTQTEPGSLEEALEILDLLDAGEPLNSTAAQFGMMAFEVEELLECHGLEI